MSTHQGSRGSLTHDQLPLAVGMHSQVPSRTIRTSSSVNYDKRYDSDDLVEADEPEKEQDRGPPKRSTVKQVRA